MTACVVFAIKVRRYNVYGVHWHGSHPKANAFLRRFHEFLDNFNMKVWVQNILGIVDLPLQSATSLSLFFLMLVGCTQLLLFYQMMKINQNKTYQLYDTTPYL
jgi:hypothetical protein